MNRLGSGSAVLLVIALVGPLEAGAQGRAEPTRADAGTEGPTSTDAPVHQTVITATRLPRPLRDVPATVVVLPREELESSPNLVTDSLVKAVPSVATFRRSTSLTADPTSQGVNLRGVGPSAVSRTLVLLDGVPVNDPFGGWVYWRALPSLGLERIEIVPGGASALYGNFALGGVVQLVSRPILENSLEAEARYGSFTTAQGAARAAGLAGAVRGAIEVEGLTSAGFTPVAPESRGAIDQRAPSQHAALNGRIEADLSDTARISARASHFAEHQNGGTALTTARVRVTDVSVRSEVELPRDSTLALALFGRLQNFQQQRARVAPNRSAESVASTQEVPTNDQGMSLLWTAPTFQLLGEHRLSLGLDGRRIEGRSDEGAGPDRSAGGQQQFGGAFVEDLFSPGGGWELSAALRLDGWRNHSGRLSELGEPETLFEDRSGIQLNPRVGALHRWSDAAAVRASVWRAFRAPTLNELYRPFQVGRIVTAANENLRPETLWGGELGVEFAPMERLTTRTTLFWNELFDPITNVTLPAPVRGADRQRQNLGRARIRGVELNADVRLHRAWVVLAGYTFVEPIVTAAPSQPELIGKRLPQDPEHRGSLAVRFNDPELFGFTVQARWTGPQFEDDLNALGMPGYVLVDAFVSRRLVEGLDAFITIENLFNRTYLVGRAGIDTVGQPFTVFGGGRWAL